jgi:ABC-type phosphate/phosphonate transport system ATPase subunit
MYENEVNARNNLMGTLSQLQTLSQESPNVMIVQFFMQGKSQELIKIFKKASSQEKAHVVEILQKVDITNAGNYKQELK